MVADIKSEPWPGSNRNPRPACVGIRTQVPEFDPAAHIESEFLPFCDPFTQYAMVAADEAMATAGFARKDIAGSRTAVVIGTGIGGFTTIDNKNAIETRILQLRLLENKVLMLIYIRYFARLFHE
jgi:nodulation protein E